MKRWWAHFEDGVPGEPTYAIPSNTRSKTMAFLGAARMTHPMTNGVPGATRIEYKANPKAADRRRDDVGGVHFFDYVNNAAYITGLFDTWPSTWTPPASTYSLRMYHHIPLEGLAGSPAHLISFQRRNPIGSPGGPLSKNDPLIEAFTVQLGDYRWTGQGSPFDFSYQYGSYQPYMEWPDASKPGGLDATTRSLLLTDRILQGKTWRTEIQVQPTNPKVTIKFYDGNSTTPFKTVTSNATVLNGTADRFVIGSRSTAGLQQPTWIGDIEIFDSYDLDGTAGQPYVDTTMTAHKVTAPDTLSVAGTSDGIITAPDTVDAARKLTKYTFRRREWVVDASNWDYQDGILYHPGMTGRSFLIYTPKGNPPPGGWPLCGFGHGGFYYQNGRYDFPAQVRNWCILNRIAFASYDYIPGTPFIGYVAQPTWPTAGSGEFPSWIVDSKLFLRHMQLNAGDYDVNPDLVFMIGFSAGGFGPMGCAASIDLDDFHGRDLTVRNTALGGNASWEDPVPAGTYVWSSPVNMELAFQYDPTHPDFGTLDQDVGNLRVTANVFMGTDFRTHPDMTGTGIDEMVRANADLVVPMGYCHGGADYLVHWEHVDALRDACADESIPFYETRNDAFHDLASNEFHPHHFEQYLKARGL